MPSAGIYARISDDSENLGEGVTRQIEDCTRLATQLGIEVTDTYVDNDTSAYSGVQRPEWQRLIEDVRSGRIDTILAYRTDRMYRSVFEDLAEVARVVQDTNVRIETVASGTVDLTTADGLMVAIMLAAVAQGESQRMAERIRRQRIQAAERGERPAGGRRAFGYKDNSFSEQEPEEARMIRQAADELLAGASLSRIVSEWNEQGSRTPSGRRWTTGNFRRMMLSEHIAGIRHHRPSGTITTGVWEPIITPDEHAYLNRRFPGTGPSRASSTQAPRPSRRRALLSGMCYCAACGKKMIRSGGRYVCDRGRGEGCGETRVHDGLALELRVLDLALERARELAAEYQASPKTELEIETVHHQLSGRHARMSELTDMFGNGELTRSEFNRLRGANAEAIRNLETRLQELMAPKRSRVADLEAARLNMVNTRGLELTADDVAEMQEPLIDTIGDRVWVHPRPRRQAFDPAQVTLYRNEDAD